jgi:hypothetical protein
VKILPDAGGWVEGTLCDRRGKEETEADLVGTRGREIRGPTPAPHPPACQPGTWPMAQTLPELSGGC